MRAQHGAMRAALNDGKNTVEFSAGVGDSMSKKVIEVKGVSKTFDTPNGPLVIAKDLSIKILRGDRIGIIGPNGAGKSTVLAALTDRAPLEAGHVSLDGAPMERFHRREVARRVSVLQQHFRSTFPFRAHEIVAMGRAPFEGLESAATRAGIVEEAMAAVGVHDLADRPCDRLSGGERPRTYLARALAQIMPPPPDGPRYLLRDEPTASLDLRHQAAALAFARKAALAGVGVLAILHDLNLAARFADEVLILNQGVVAAFGPPDKIFNERTLQRVYGDGLAVFEAPGGGPVVLPRADAAA